jgi:hypothetical protein
MGKGLNIAEQVSPWERLQRNRAERYKESSAAPFATAPDPSHHIPSDRLWQRHFEIVEHGMAELFVNGGLENMWKEQVKDYFKWLFHYPNRPTTWKHEKSHQV